MASASIDPGPVGHAVQPTFLERWGVVFLSCAGGWVLLVSSAVLIYFFTHQPALPAGNGTPEQLRESLGIHREMIAQSKDSLAAVFDMLVTRTVLPIVTLLLGYLFGKKR